ncbi:MAG: ABC transporter substrate-binding protein, partial [Acetobacteraceae bacterium]
FVGTMGRIKFYGRTARFTNALEYGPEAVQGVFVQWQHGKIETIWPARVADAKISYPSFVRLPSGKVPT